MTPWTCILNLIGMMRWRSMTPWMYILSVIGRVPIEGIHIHILVESRRFGYAKAGDARWISPIGIQTTTYVIAVGRRMQGGKIRGWHRNHQSYGDVKIVERTSPIGIQITSYVTVVGRRTRTCRK